MRRLNWPSKILASIVVAFLCVFVLVWALSPVAVRHFAKQPLADLGVTLSESSQVRYNPFISRLSITDLQLLDRQRKPALVLPDASVTFTFYKLLYDELHIADISTNGGHLQIQQNQQGLTIAGVELPLKQQSDANEPESDNQQRQYRLTLASMLTENFTIDALLDGSAQTLLLERLSLNNISLDQVRQSLSMTLNAKLNDAPVAFNADAQLKNSQGEAKGKLSLQRLDLAKLSPLAKMPQLQLTGLLSLDLAPEVVLTDQGLEVKADEIALDLQKLNTVFDVWHYQSEQDKLTLSDVEVEVARDGEVQTLSAKSNGSLNQGLLALGSADNQLAGWQSLSFDPTVHVKNNQPEVSLTQFSASGVQLAPRKDSESIVALPQLMVNDINASANAVAIGQIALAGGKLNVVLNEQGELANMPDTSTLQVESEQQTDDATSQPTEIVGQNNSEKPMMAISLAGFQFSQPVLVTLHDQKTGFSKNMSVDTLQLGQLDNQKPNQKTPLLLNIKDDKYLRLNAKGEAALFSQKVNADLTAKVQELSLPNVSPYLANALGFDMQSGQLDLDVGIKITDDKLDGEANIKTRGLETTGAEGEDGKDVVGSGAAMSLNLALNTLKDDKGNLDLDVPISGDLNSPDFGIGSFLTLVLKKAAMSQAKTYLMNTFVPYAAVVSVALTGAEKLLQIRLEPLEFSPQKASWPEAGQTYVQQLAALLKDKQDLQVKLCAVSAVVDLNQPVANKLTKEQRINLLKLGEERESALKAALIEQGIASSRVLFCKPEIDDDTKAKPRIELKTD